MKETQDIWEEEHTGGVRINNIRYVDDNILLANTQEESEELINILEEEINNYRYDKRTKITIIN